MTGRAIVARDRLGVASRVLAAAAGGYLVATLAIVLAAAALPAAPLDRAMAGLLAAPLVLPAVAMLCFAVRSAGRAWLAVALLALLLALPALAAGWRP